MVGKILVIEGINAGASYSVLQLMVRDGDVAVGRRRDPRRQDHRRRPAGRRQGDRRRRQRGRRADPAQPGHRDPGDRHPPRPDPAARVGDGQPRRRRDARQVPGRRGGATPTPAASAPDLVCTPPSAGEQAVRDHLGRGVRRPAVRQPDRHRDPDRAQLQGGASQRVPARRATRRSPAAPGRFPQVSGLKVEFHCCGRDAGRSTGCGRRRTARPGR